MTGLTNSLKLMHWKRYGFLMGFLPLALPIVAWNRMETTDWQIFAWSPLVVIFGLVPLVDSLMGNDLNNPEGDVVFSLGEDRWYSSLLVVVVPLQLALVFWGVGVFVTAVWAYGVAWLDTFHGGRVTLLALRLGMNWCTTNPDLLKPVVGFCWPVSAMEVSKSNMYEDITNMLRHR